MLSCIFKGKLTQSFEKVKTRQIFVQQRILKKKKRSTEKHDTLFTSPKCEMNTGNKMMCKNSIQETDNYV